MIENLKKEVQYILENYPETRNSDITLMIEVWRKYYPSHIFQGLMSGEGVWLKSLYELPREDNIKRIREKFCEQGYAWAYPTDLKIVRARKIKESEWRRKLGYAPLPEDAPKTTYFEVDNRVYQISESKIEEFLKLNPRAVKL